jgi:DNA mismatch repair protein MutS2
MPTQPDNYDTFAFSAILEEIAAYCQYSDSGNGYILSSKWISNPDLLRQIHGELEEMDRFLTLGHIPSSGSPVSVKELILSVKIEGTPFPREELLSFKQHLEAVRKISSLAKKETGEKYPSLYSYFKTLLPLPDLLREIKRLVGNDGEIPDNASPALKEIRQKLLRANRGLQRLAGTIQKKYEKYLNESQFTIRNGRIVLPVIDSYFRKVRGIVHGRSASGITVYVEPAEMVEANNDIEELKNAEQIEIYRLMVSFAASCRREESAILQNWETLCYLDSLTARVKWMKQYHGNVANFNEDRSLYMVEARHPLLVKRIGYNEVVPLNIKLEETCPLVLVTGPNAGGKTVMLKTVAVNLILAHHGMPVIAGEKSSFPFIEKVLYDIGDRQSLENDLSTFSAHLESLKNIVLNADEKTMVLIDEMGTGTDPVEGAALARAVLEYLINAGTLGVVNSHHGSLKVFAQESSGITNASMEFDTAELRPTYRLRMDIPGSSYALEIARRMNFPPEVLKRAEELLGDRRRHTENLILSLQDKLTETERLRKELDLEKNKYIALEKLYRQTLSKLEKNKKEMEKKALSEAEDILRRANSAVENAVREIREKQADKAAVKKSRKKISELKNEIQTRKARFKEPSEPFSPEKFYPGDRVEWIKMNQKGEVLEILGENRLLLAVGNLKLQAPAGECRLLKKSKTQEKIKKSGGTPLPKVGMEIDLRGKYTDEAEYLLEKYISDAAAAGWEEIRIIHGHGTGALKNMVGVFLKKNPYVKKFRPGIHGEGGPGVTVVSLK